MRHVHVNLGRRLTGGYLASRKFRDPLPVSKDEGVLKGTSVPLWNSQRELD